ncbi:MAG: BspA family leucine-rich repeat surface protein [Opitutales bacterium]|nr:BspA family leucine-rich repeat surface protein [Opitutales bacterium]
MEPGSFTMGQAGVVEPVHDVTLTKGFYLGKCEVTQAQYEAVITGNTNGLSATPSNWPNNPNRPVEKVSWEDIQVFLSLLNEQQANNIPAGWAYVLPTEAQWEYACRAGTISAYSWGDGINDEHANGPSSGYAQTRNVGLYPANLWGFFDMHGNVWEWTADASGPYTASSQVDPYNQGGTDSYRVSRGGSWGYSSETLQSARRAFDLSNHRNGGFGFRLAYKYANKSPIDLNSTAVLTIAENQTVGTIVGEFNATDLEGGLITYSLASGENNNPLFMLDTNGTLKTATTFDYESNASTYAITVQAWDEYNATVEGNFTVTLTDDIYEDTDGDGFSDAEEIAAGTDPNDAASKPNLNFGLVAWYPFDGNASDMSGNGNHGTVNGATLGTDRHGAAGKAYSFDGVDDYIVSSGNTFDTQDKGTISLWFNDVSTTNSGGGILGSRRGYVQGDFLIGNLESGDGFRVLFWNSKNSAWAGWGSGIETTLSKWNHLLLTWEKNGSSVLKFNNNQVQQAVDSFPIFGENLLYIGSESFEYFTSFPAVHFHGLVDEVRIYDRALSASEVLSLYNLEKPKTALTDANFQDAVNLWFSDELNATMTYGHISDWNTSAVTDMSNAFKNRASFNEDIGRWDVSNVTNMYYMLMGARVFNQDVSNWDTSSVTNMTRLFYDCVLFNQDIADWNTSLVSNMVCMFFNASTFNQDISDWNVSSLVLANGMFRGATNFNQDISDWNISSVSIMDDFFLHASSLSATNKGLIHESFASNPNWPYDWGDFANQAPVGLTSTANLSFGENQGVGSLVGRLIATDPDGNAVTFSLVNGQGDTHNSLFTLETNGTLRTATIFDYESNASVYSVRVRAEDESGSLIEDSFTIFLEDLDDESPVISLFRDVHITHEAGTLFHDPGASWADNTDGFGEIFGLGEVNASKPGMYFLIYDHVDQTGNEAESITRTVAVVDTTSPVITLIGEPEIILEAGIAYIDPGASWTDIVDGNGTLLGQGGINSLVPGVYELTYSKTDQTGNGAKSITRTVTVVDTLAPLITLTGESEIILESGSAFLDSGATWTDIVDGNGTLVGQGEVNTLVPDIYQLTYSKTDVAGNMSASLIRTVTVVDTLAPLITLTGESEIILESGSAFIDPGATWADIVDGNGTLVGNGEVNTLVPGIYELTYSKTDEAGNAAIRITRTVTVVNDAPDSLVLSGNEVEENLAANTLVGQFFWSDPNDLEGIGSYQLELVNEEGKANFRLDENGTLLTRTSLDFETAPSHELLVRLSDGYGGILEELFIVEVIDAFLPIVYTVESVEVGGRHVVAAGEVMDEGGSEGVSTRGFLVSGFADARMADAQVIRSMAGKGWGAFTRRVNGLQVDQKYYVRAFATNAEGTAYGSSLRIQTQAYDLAPEWSNAQKSAYVEGWWSSPWFGTFYTQDDSGWIHHAAMGWAYAMPVKDGGVWLWTEATGWAWTEQGTYPFLYANDWQSWLYFYGQSKGQIIFFRYSDNQWLIKPPTEGE